jgi:hypothetical protein
LTAVSGDPAAAFAQALPGEFGTSPRTGTVRLPGVFNDDLSATKGFKFGESTNLQLRADFFNAFKHYNPDPSTITLARFMWMGLPGGKARHDLPWVEVAEGQVQPVNNWDAWICWNWLTSALFIDRNEDRRYKSVQKITVCLDKFINTYPDDGGCEEGPGYWNLAAGAMFDALELLHSSTAGAVDIYGQPLITRWPFI